MISEHLLQQSAEEHANIMPDLPSTRSGKLLDSTGSIASKSPTVSKKTVPGETEFMHWIEQAEYEVNVDPYRGIQFLLEQHRKQQQHKTSESTTVALTENQAENSGEVDSAEMYDAATVGWWRKNCSLRHYGETNHRVIDLCSSTPDTTDSVDVQEACTTPHTSEQFVRMISGSTCPSLIQWTERVFKEQEKKKHAKRKRKRSTFPDGRSRCFGRREPNICCPCDFNPFCLGTLGGAMDDILDKWANERSVDVPQQVSSTANEIDVVNNNDLIVEADVDVAVDEPMPGEVAREELSRELYSPKTLEQLNTVRKYIMADEMAIRLYLRNILQGLTAVMSLDECIDRLRHQHHSLVFVNPLMASPEGSATARSTAVTSKEGEKICLAIPPGIENLGATCYLNTQLQCLAQNRVFVEGIMSWKPSGAADDGTDRIDRMSSVLALFQDLLARMIAGPYSTVNTIEFSNALGLDHFEQQDPNEFSRLLFERMHISFKGGSKESNLSDLLPRLFQGVMVYETTCLACQTKSKRTEEFMDINLPIVRPISTKSSSERIFEKFFPSNGDTELQFCLDQYCQEETLDGDNQYLCSQCTCKCDAKRALTFQKLPPVLNVQICRYVFDREKLVKKKLSDKVLLPLELTVQARTEDARAGATEHRYVLCAVMRHKGTSAYSGHYVAETMDWLSGQWFEFNDDKVILLAKGPSCSFDPHTFDWKQPRKGVDGNKRQKVNTVIEGSQDAYNLYYVDEAFLAQSTIESLRQQNGVVETKPFDDPQNVVDKISEQRSNYYYALRQMCVDDEKVANRLEKRRHSICANMFPSLSAFQIRSPEEVVWVETVTLLQFMSCRDRLQKLEEARDSCILQHRKLLCSHSPPGLHPRIARNGKVLTLRAYNAYVETLREEHRNIFGSDVDDNSITDVLIVPAINLVCQECASTYQSELSEKLHLARKLKSMYDALCPKAQNFLLELNIDETCENECDQYAYIVSRKFVTWFRNKVMRCMKQAAKAVEDWGDIETQVGGIVEKRSVLEGLDGADFSEFDFVKTGISACTILDDEGITVLVNGPLTCIHGNFVTDASANSFLYVPWSLWGMIKDVFPKAIEHRKKRFRLSTDLEYEGSFVDDVTCKICQEERLAKISTRNNLAELSKIFHESQGWVSLSNDEIIEMVTSQRCRRFYIVHNDDIAAWKKALSAFKRKDASLLNGSLNLATIRPCGRSEKWQASIFHHFAGNLVSENDRNRLELFTTIFRPIACLTHGHWILDSVFQNVDSANIDEPLSLKDTSFCIFDEKTYLNFITLVGAAAVALYPSDPNGATVQSCISESMEFFNSMEAYSKFHPSCVPTERSVRSKETSLFVVANEKLSLKFQLESNTCSNESCLQEYLEKRDSASIRLVDRSDNPSSSRTGEADDPIDVDADLKTNTFQASKTQALKIFDVEADADGDSTLASLSSYIGLSLTSEQHEGQFCVRRSSRRRTCRFPMGCILEEQTLRVDFDNNIAALRLFLFERCTKGTAFELDHRLTLVYMRSISKCKESALESGSALEEGILSNVDSLPHLQCVELTFDMNTKTLREICEDNVEMLLVQTENVFIIRQANSAKSAGEIPKDNLMDHLISLANTSEVVPTGDTQKNRKSKESRSEKGFTGTFLSSIVPEKGVHESELSSPPSGELAADDAPVELPVNQCDDLVHMTAKNEIGYAAKTVQSAGNTKDIRVSSNILENDDQQIVHIDDTAAPIESNSVVLSPESVDLSISNHNSVNHNERLSSPGKFSEPNVLEDDDNVELLRYSPFAKKKHLEQTVTSRRCVDVPSELLVATMDDPSPEDDGVGNSSRRLSTRGSGNNRTFRISQLAYMLQSNPDIGHHENREAMCQMAAENAVDTHPDQANVHELVESAYAVYLDLTLP